MTNNLFQNFHFSHNEHFWIFMQMFRFSVQLAFFRFSKQKLPILLNETNAFINHTIWSLLFPLLAHLPNIVRIHFA